MRKKALIFDLDNTVYPVSSIGDNLFGELFSIIRKHGGYGGNVEDIKKEIMRKPFQKVAIMFDFADDLTSKGLKLLSDLTCNAPISPFSDYFFIKDLKQQKFLVTSGFRKLQQSKIERLNIKNDFEEIFIVDPIYSEMTKKDYFEKILKQYRLDKSEVLIIGDDLNSEIKAGKELGIDTVIYDYLNVFNSSSPYVFIKNYSELEKYIYRLPSGFPSDKPIALHR